ncbi:hypothetical protein BT69DRAFT_1214118 [Atractiella rhizophila]|nr:hypothetical protein BT69DRAFT_1214118 [Atractiella rhizophila]
MKYGLRPLPFTTNLPRTDIHQITRSELMHQLYKGVFLKHLKEWTVLLMQLYRGHSGCLNSIRDFD